MALLNGVSSPWLAAFAVVVLLLYLAFSGTTLRRNGVPLKKPPGTLPLLGNGIIFLRPRQRLFTWFSRREREFGYETYQISVPTLPPGVVINDPRNLEYVFKNEALFNKGEFVKRRSWDLFGYGIINVDGDLWRAQRKAGLHFLNTANLRILTDVALPRYLSQAMEHLGRRAADGDAVVDLQAVFHEVTSRLMGKMAYNMEMHADDAFTTAFDRASGATAERFQNPLWPVTEPLLGAGFRRSLAVVKSYGREIVASAVRDRRRQQGQEQQKQQQQSVGEKEEEEDGLEGISGSLIQSLLDSIGDETMVADAALNYLSAGRDTTAQALTWTFYLLMKHRYVVGRIRREVQGILSSSSSSSGADHRHHADDDRGRGSSDAHNSSGQPPLDTARFTPSSMPYTMAVFYESLRLHPPVPFEVKQCAREAVLPDGTVLPRDSVVLWCPWSMGRSVVTWGPDADAFRPERWLVGSSTTANDKPEGTQQQQLNMRSASEFPVFNGGARTCLGKKMAELMAVQVVAAVAWAFEFVPADGGSGERVSRSSLTLPMEGGLPVFVKRRNCCF